VKCTNKSHINLNIKDNLMPRRLFSRNCWFCGVLLVTMSYGQSDVAEGTSK